MPQNKEKIRISAATEQISPLPVKRAVFMLRDRHQAGV